MFGIDWKYILWGSWLLLLTAAYQIILPLTLGLSDLYTEVRATGAQLQPQEMLQAEILELEAANKALDARIRRTLVRIPARRELSALYQTLGDCAAQHRVQLTKLLPRPLPPGDKYAELELEAVIHARFENLARYLYDLEFRQGIFRIHAVSLQPAPGEEGELEGQIGLRVYYTVN